jgi:hypothetical protein
METNAPIKKVQTQLYDYYQNGGIGCTIAYFISWFIFAALVYYKFGLIKSYTFSYVFFFICIGMIVLFGIEINDDIENN